MQYTTQSQVQRKLSKGRTKCRSMNIRQQRLREEMQLPWEHSLATPKEFLRLTGRIVGVLWPVKLQLLRRFAG